MANFVNAVIDPVKALYIGESGAGKTGALAALAAAGLKLRIVDTDKGVKALRNLLTDYHYPYRAYMEKHGVDLAESVNFISIDTKIGMKTIVNKFGEKTTTENILAPKAASSWGKIMSCLNEWKDGDINYGHVETWGPDCVLVLDSISTMSKQAYYFLQSLNGRLGARDTGYDYQRDVGEAQAQVTRLLELIYDSNVKCNVIGISHITWVDESKGVAARPRGDIKVGKDEEDEYVPPPKGLPSAIGRALSPQMGKYFNDVYIAESVGFGSAVKRTISTVPNNGVLAKNSVYLEKSYPVSTGLAEIFAAHGIISLPPDFVSSLRAAPKSSVSAAPTTKAVA